METKNRIKKVLTVSLFLLTVGIIYIVICFNTEYRIPCVFRLVTGLKCPGCGVTGMLLSLLRFDFTSAFESNGAVLVMLPVGAVVTIDYLLRYIKSGEKMLTVPSRAVVITMTVILIVFGILRNIQI